MQHALRKEFLNVPNYITFGRLFCVPIIVVLLSLAHRVQGYHFLSPALSAVTSLIFTVAMLSDLVDGYYARKHHLISTFGKFFDPLADKLLFLAAMIMMIPLERIPAWLVVVFFVREVTITALRGIAIDKHIVIAASQWGKYKSTFVSIACVGLIAHYPFFGIEWRLIGWLFMVPALAFSLGSGIHYTAGFIQALMAEPPGTSGEQSPP